MIHLPIHTHGYPDGYPLGRAPRWNSFKKGLDARFIARARAQAMCARYLRNSSKPFIAFVLFYLNHTLQCTKVLWNNLHINMQIVPKFPSPKNPPLFVLGKSYLKCFPLVIPKTSTMLSTPP